jgi:hypothetical protein
MPDKPDAIPVPDQPELPSTPRKPVQSTLKRPVQPPLIDERSPGVENAVRSQAPRFPR